jgi:hypothetical protein
MTKLIAPLLLTLVLTACGGGGGGGTASTAAVTTSTASLNTVISGVPGIVKNMAVGDLNNDGIDDVVVGGWGGSGNTANIYVLIQNSNGTLTDKTTSYLPVTTYPGSQHIFIKDFDGDGKNDIFIPGFNDGCTNGCSVHSMIFWNGTGQFTQQILPELTDAHGACVDDINNDGKLDILLRGVYDQQTHSVQGGLYVNNGNRSFTFNTNLAAGATCSINHESNGNISIVSGNSNKILTYDSNLNLTATVSIASQDTAANDLIDSISMDVNGDGSKDFVLVFDNTSDNTKGRKEVWLNDGSGNYSYSYTIDSDSYSYYHHNVFTHNGIVTVYFSGANLQAKLYQIQNGQFVAYQQSRFKAMATQAGYYPGFTWSVDTGIVYQNSSTGKIYMLQSINSVLYTQEL